MRNTIYTLMFTLFLVMSQSCTENITVKQTLNTKPALFPDYDETVIPCNIAPLNFKILSDDKEVAATFAWNGYTFQVRGNGRQIRISPSDWKKLLEKAKGDTVNVTVARKKAGIWEAYLPIKIQVAEETIDPYLVYRLIEPGYELWSEMGIYQRNLTNFDETPVIENHLTGKNCMNCHAFCAQDPNKMVLHMRATYPCTILIDGDKMEKLNTQTEQTISPLVYPSWHPSGNYIAFSVNETQQAFHISDKNRVEVFDKQSDVVVYDAGRHEIVTSPLLFSKTAYETFPTFSPDGKTLYFCSAEAKEMPKEFSKAKYNLCSISFDPATRTFGQQVDTLYNASGSKSVSFPRVSPDGRFLLYTLSGYGNFSIWHKDADLYMADLQTKKSFRLGNACSDDVESYHSWSSNSHWIVFSSRRIDGLYTRPYIAFIDPKSGEASKPFLLPQEDPDYYERSLKSFNIPELVKGEIDKPAYQIAITAKKEPGVNITFHK